MKNIITYKRITSEYNNVCYINSIFALFLYLYINKGGSSTLFISHVDFQDTLKNSKLDNVIILDSKLNGKWDSLLYKFGLLQYDINSYIKGKHFFGHDHITYAFLFNLEKGSILEDGIGNYNGPIPLKNQIKRALKGRVISPLGYSNKIQYVYLSRPEDADVKLEKKIKPFSMVSFLDYTRNHSLSIIFDKVSPSLKNKKILFTQPISEAGIVSEDEKIQIYKEIIDKYNIDMIKPHPRDISNYSKSFKCSIVDKFIPAEAMISPEDKDITLYTLNSTSLYNLKKVNSNITIKILLSDLHQNLNDWKKGQYKL
ncbi:lipooligosaccharide sialyltransferase [Vibrio campbellii]|uniref:glycosyltransferase family 52 n=1 Tax=Vibrio campbellii TaxID=680 RepID=UPI003908DACB